MKRQLPKTVIVLIIVFVWSLWKDLEQLARSSTSSDAALFKHVGLGSVFIAVIAVMVVLDAATLWFLFKPLSLVIIDPWGDVDVAGCQIWN